MKKNQNKVAMVTGAASGIGYAVAQRFLSSNVATILVDINNEKLDVVTKSLQKDYDNVFSFICDLTKEEEVQLLIPKIIEKVERIDILVNCAGVSPIGSVTEISLLEFRKTIDINLISIFLTCKYILPYMMSMENGVIINIVGTLGLKAIRRKASYCATKAAVHNLSQQMALDYGDYGIRINSVSPGFVDTPLNKDLTDEIRSLILESQPLHKAASGQDIAESVYFLSSDAASLITGTNLVIDGGQSASQGSLSAVDYWASRLGD